MASSTGSVQGLRKARHLNVAKSGLCSSPSSTRSTSLGSLRTARLLLFASLHQSLATRVGHLEATEGVRLGV
jgi:hypothetical protein